MVPVLAADLALGLAGALLRLLAEALDLPAALDFAFAAAALTFGWDRVLGALLRAADPVFAGFLRAADALRLTAFFAVDLRPPAFLTGVFFLVALLVVLPAARRVFAALPAVFLVAAFFAAGFFAAARFAVARFAVAFPPVAFFAAAFRAGVRFRDALAVAFEADFAAALARGRDFWVDVAAMICLWFLTDSLSRPGTSDAGEIEGRVSYQNPLTLTI